MTIPAPKRFYSVQEQQIGDKWLEHYRIAEPAYRQWFLREGELKRPDLTTCEAALREFMPELWPYWQQMLRLTNADDQHARMLSFYCPAANVTGCSQIAWTRYPSVLIRNYDYSPALCEGRIAKSQWQHTQVLGSTDCLWGLLDGMNQYGLCVSLAFGGGDETGEGFAMPIILRYVLETCKTTLEAVAVLCRVPSYMAYNITVLDAYGQVRTVELNPLSSPVVSIKPFAMNHQGEMGISNYAMFSHSYEREQAIIHQLYDPIVNVEALISSFEYSPFFNRNYRQNFGTLYTAVYNPALLACEFRWPHQLRMYQSISHFDEQEVWVNYE